MWEVASLYSVGFFLEPNKLECQFFNTYVIYIIMADQGELYTWGSNENGCLGLGYFHWTPFLFYVSFSFFINHK